MCFKPLLIIITVALLFFGVIYFIVSFLERKRSEYLMASITSIIRPRLEAELKKKNINE